MCLYIFSELCVHLPFQRMIQKLAPSVQFPHPLPSQGGSLLTDVAQGRDLLRRFHAAPPQDTGGRQQARRKHIGRLFNGIILRRRFTVYKSAVPHMTQYQMT